MEEKTGCFFCLWLKSKNNIWPRHLLPILLGHPSHDDVQFWTRSTKKPQSKKDSLFTLITAQTVFTAHWSLAIRQAKNKWKSRHAVSNSSSFSNTHLLLSVSRSFHLATVNRKHPLYILQNTHIPIHVICSTNNNHLLIFYKSMRDQLSKWLFKRLICHKRVKGYVLSFA